MIAALFVDSAGVYSGLSGVDLWDIDRDARNYRGPFPVVAHPPCQRWGKFWHGSTRNPHQFTLGDDDGCFESALESVRRHSGVLEHPAYSYAWDFYGMTKPAKGVGWSSPDEYGGSSCYVEQGHYGHFSRKRTWLYACGTELVDLEWTESPQRIHPAALAKHGYEKARRIGVVAMVGGKNKTQVRNATPIEFRDVLLDIARSASNAGVAQRPELLAFNR